MLNQKGNLFGVAQWLTADADSRQPRDPGLPGASRCDRSGCVGTLGDGRILAFVFDRASLHEDCARADIVVTRLWIGEACRGPDTILDGRWFDGHGATEIRFGHEGEPIIRTHRTPNYDRPWARARLQPIPTVPAPPPALDSDGEDEADPSAFMP